MHIVDRPWGHEHDHGRGPGYYQPDSRPVVAGRHLCTTQRGARFATIGVSREPGYLRERLFSARLSLLGPHPAAGTASYFSAGSNAGSDIAGRNGRCDLLALPQDVQTEAYDYPEEFFERRVWTVARPRADSGLLKQAVEWIRSSQRPLIIAGGGVIYAEATNELIPASPATLEFR